MDGLTVLENGYYIFCHGKKFKGPFRPIYAKGFIDGLHTSWNGTYTHSPPYYLVEVRSGKIREMRKKNAKSSTSKTD